jgi:HD-GYP domain-containing protein (c-di-GMP phosphodiesterase class II)
MAARLTMQIDETSGMAGQDAGREAVKAGTEIPDFNPPDLYPPDLYPPDLYPPDLYPRPGQAGEQAEELLGWLRRANQAAAATRLEDLLEQVLHLLIEACGASGGALYLPRKEGDDWICRIQYPSFDAAHSQLTWLLNALLAIGLRDGEQSLQAGDAVRLEAGSLASKVSLASQEEVNWAALFGRPVEHALLLPFLRPCRLPAGAEDHEGGRTGGPAGGKAGDGIRRVVALALLLEPSAQPAAMPAAQPAALPAYPAQQLLSLLAERLASEIDKAVQLEASRKRVERLAGLISIFQRIGATLDRDELLRLIIEYARQVIHAEAASLFLVDSTTGENVLHLASNVNQAVRLEHVRVPPGKGIIGEVVNSGQTVLVPDVSHDERHYQAVDQRSGFSTRAILAAPLRARQVLLGGEQGLTHEQIIGGLEALNKIQETFDREDAEMLVTLANQAATVLEIATLYAEARELFMDVIGALAAAIDAKDPYTEGHSQRVSELALEIGREMGLPGEELHHLRIGSLLHDIGKIGIPDAILRKPGALSAEEYGVMQAHPAIGARILERVRTLRRELPALAEHHERMDGSGYPRRLRGQEISLFGRITAVADVFDALTSDRPYRRALSAKEALDYLSQRTGGKAGGDYLFDRGCVEGLAYAIREGSAPGSNRGDPL